MDKELICCSCLQNESLFLNLEPEEGFCNYCKTDLLVVPLSMVIDEIRKCIESLYDHPENCLGRVDGEWIEGNGQLIDSYDLINNMFNITESPAFEHILLDFNDEQWCPKEGYSQNEEQIQLAMWQSFKNIIIHKRRYFFLNDQTELDDHHENRSPINILHSINRTINKIGLHKTYQPGKLFYRARDTSGNSFERNSSELGAPSIENANKPNRMSPAGISMFYCAENVDTCMAEIGAEKFVLSKWKSIKPLTIIDFVSDFEPIYGIIQFKHDHFIEDRYRSNFHDINFICKFIKEVSSPISDNDKIIDYIPTQVIAEYLRYEFSTESGSLIDGIRYRSSLEDGINYCLFFGQEGCLPGDLQKVTLDSHEEHDLSQEAI